MAQEYIEIKGARENNLKNVSLRIPKKKITVFTGVSGSGKSSLVLDTIAMETARYLS
jgi:excinuclease UvrABC ATPase subunit